MPPPDPLDKVLCSFPPKLKILDITLPEPCQTLSNLQILHVACPTPVGQEMLLGTPDPLLGRVWKPRLRVRIGRDY